MLKQLNSQRRATTEKVCLKQDDENIQQTYTSETT